LPRARSELIRGALADRPDPWTRVFRPARPGSVEATLRFVDHVVAGAAGRPTHPPGGGPI
ncbi:MAG: hypothetical protein M3O55_05550, partial [Actinomycetota bacterium]|nr:hypothetical protein [Actinomycetota bacterium]